MFSYNKNKRVIYLTIGTRKKKKNTINSRSIVYAYVNPSILAGLLYWIADFLKKSNGMAGRQNGIVCVRFYTTFFKNKYGCLLADLIRTFELGTANRGKNGSSTG